MLLWNPGTRVHVRQQFVQVLPTFATEEKEVRCVARGCVYAGIDAVKYQRQKRVPVVVRFVIGVLCDAVLDDLVNPLDLPIAGGGDSLWCW